MKKTTKMYQEMNYRILNNYQVIYWANDDLATVRKVAASAPSDFTIVDLNGTVIPKVAPIL